MDNLKIFGSILLIVLISSSASGQNSRSVRTNSVLLPDAQTGTEERLVQLAWQNHPSNKIAVYNSIIARKNMRQAQLAWFDRFKVMGNLNEFTLNPTRYERSDFYPRYNFSIQLSMGDFSILPLEVRKRREEAEIAKQEMENQKLFLRTEVLKRYNHYLSVKDQLVIQKKLESEISLNLELARNKFTEGGETYSTFSSLIEKHYNQQLRTKELEEALQEAELSVEEMIGVQLESVIEL